MHEFALADAVVKTALRVAGDAGIDHIERVSVSVGELQQIRCDLFEFSLNEVLPRDVPALAGTQFEVSVEQVGFRCRVCDTAFGRADAAAVGAEALEAVHMVPELAHAYYRCPGCGSPDFEIVAGRGIILQRVEGRASDGRDG